MKTLLSLLMDDAAPGTVSTGNIASVRGGHEQNSKAKKRKTMRRTYGNTNPVLHFIRVAEAADFNAQAVVSQLQAAEKEASAVNDTQSTVYGLEDVNGAVVKVFVKSDQAQDFEQVLQNILRDKTNDIGDSRTADNQGIDVAELLHSLKDQFDIVDVQWPATEEEEDSAPESDDLDMDATEGDVGVDDLDATADDALEGDVDDLGGDADATVDGTMSALNQMIDMMKADAEARKAEADAKRAEAVAKQAELQATAAMAKVRQEEDVLDMESYYKNKKEEDRETERLAKLVKWKHDMAADAVPAATEVEDEESTSPITAQPQLGQTATSVTPQQLLDLLKQRAGVQR